MDDDEEVTTNEIIKRACIIMDKLEIDRTLAHKNIQKSQQKQKESYQQDRHPQIFFIGDKVLMKRMEMQHWHHEKFSQKLKELQSNPSIVTTLGKWNFGDYRGVVTIE